MLTDQEQIEFWIRYENLKNEEHEFPVYVIPSSWTTLCYEAHNNLRKYFSSESGIDGNVKIESNSLEIRLENSEVISLLNIIENVLSRDLDLKTKNEIISIIKSSKYIDKYNRICSSTKSFRNFLIHNIKTSDMHADYLVNVLNGAFQAKKIVEGDYTVRIGYSPIDFLNLGTHKCDSDSCFRAGKENDHHKFILGANQDTIVLTVEDLTSKNVVARAWGTCVPDDMLVLNNIYSTIGRNTFRSIIDQFLPSKTKFKHIYKGRVEISGVYLNPTEKIIACVNEKTTEPYYERHYSRCGLDKKFYCDACSDYVQGQHNYQVMTKMGSDTTDHRYTLCESHANEAEQEGHIHI